MPAHAWFLKIASVHTEVCVCLPLRALITSGVIWCDWLNLLYSFQFLAVNEVDGCGFGNTDSTSCTPGKEDKVDTVQAIEVGI